MSMDEIDMEVFKAFLASNDHLLTVSVSAFLASLDDFSRSAKPEQIGEQEAFPEPPALDPYDDFSLTPEEPYRPAEEDYHDEGD